MKKTASFILLALLSSCSLNPFSKEEPKYKPYVPKEEREKSPYSGVKNVVYYMKKEFTPLEGEVVLNSYDGYIIDVGKDKGVSVGDRFITESGAVLKVVKVSKEYSVALPTLGKPLIGEKAERLLFNRVLFIDFTSRKKGKELYRELKKEVPSLKLANYEEGKAFKEKFHLKFPSDFKRKVPTDKLTGYDGYIVVSDIGAEVYDSTKKLIKIFPWNGAPVSSYSLAPGSGYKVVLDFKGHATSLFVGNIDSSPQEEIVITTENDIRVYRATPYGVKEVYKFQNPFKGSYLFHICPVDLNKDGVEEFVIDGFYKDSKGVKSGLFKVVKGKLVKVAESSLILSGFDTNGDGENDEIFGQEVSSEGDKLFGRNVWKLKVKGHELIKVSKVKVPEGFQTTSAQMFKNSGKYYFAYYDLNYYLKVSEGKEVLWSSPIQIGASPNCLYWYDGDMLVSYYITPKPKPIDIDSDGNQEVLFSQNKNAVPGILRNIYSFDGGRILLLYKGSTGFSWQEATPPIYKMGGIEEFGYLPQYDLFVAIFTKVGILQNPKSKLLFIKPEI